MVRQIRVVSLHTHCFHPAHYMPYVTDVTLADG